MEELFGLRPFLTFFNFVEVGDGQAGATGKFLKRKPFAQPVVAYFEAEEQGLHVGFCHHAVKIGCFSEFSQKTMAGFAG